MLELRMVSDQENYRAKDGALRSTRRTRRRA
jgi:hypothetical protein